MKRRRRLAGLVAGVLRVALRRRPRSAGVILAAGSGTRMGGGIPKQFLPVCGVPILIRSVRAFDACPGIDEIVIVTRETDIQAVKDLCAEYEISQKLKTVIAGGDTRQKSAFLGVEATSRACRYVAIHDAARCLLTPDVIRSVLEAAYLHRAATAVYPVTDTIKRVDGRGRIKETLDRTALFAAATPQAFERDYYIAVAAYAEKMGTTVTDDNGLFEAVGQTVYTVDCGNENFKVTTPSDLIRAEATVRAREKKETPI